MRQPVSCRSRRFCCQKAAHALRGAGLAEQVGEGMFVQLAKECLPSILQRSAQSANCRDHTSIALLVETLDQGKAVLGRPHNGSQIDVPRKLRQAQATASTAQAVDESCLDEPLRDFGQVVARYSVPPRGFIHGVKLVRLDRQKHEQAQRKIGVLGQAQVGFVSFRQQARLARRGARVSNIMYPKYRLIVTAPGEQ